MTIYCSQCGKPNAADATTCAACGNELRAPSEAPRRFKGTMILGNPYKPDAPLSPPSAATPENAAKGHVASKTLFGNPSGVPPHAQQQHSGPPTDPIRGPAAAGKRTLIAGSGFGNSPSSIPSGMFSDAPPARGAESGPSSPPSGTVRIGSPEAHETFSALKSTQPISSSAYAKEMRLKKYFGRLGTWSVVVGLLSFIPLYGVPFALLAMSWGWITRRQGGVTLLLLGAAGFAIGTIGALSTGMHFLNDLRLNR